MNDCLHLTAVWCAGMRLTGRRQCSGTHGMQPITATPLSPSSWSASGRQAGLQARCCLPEDTRFACTIFGHPADRCRRAFP